MTSTAPVPAGLFRRFAAATYDVLLLIGVLMLATLVSILLTGGNPVATGEAWYQLLLIAVTALFFVWFWVHGGQTVGMKTWRLRVETQSGEPLTWKTGVLRFVAVILSLIPLGLGFFWSMIDRDQLTWHDRLAGTRVVIVPKSAR
jgi:uncharacterized RDD family membrane protein YckC